jgi:hypothetical protein
MAPPQIDRLFATLAIQRECHRALRRAIAEREEEVARGDFSAVLARVTVLQSLQSKLEDFDSALPALDQASPPDSARSLQTLGAALSAERALTEHAWRRTGWFGVDQRGAEDER